MVKLLVAAVALAALSSVAYAQMVRQCTCTEIGPCKSGYVNSVVPCADQCKQHASALGANYNKLRSCLTSREGQIRSTMQCVESKHRDACSAGRGGMVQKRYPESLRIAALSEINRMLGRSGVSGQAQLLLASGKKFISCIRSCMDKKSGSCAKRLGCGLKLPSDTALVQEAKTCAISSGFNTQTIKQLCTCAADAGIAQLRSICPKLQIS